jgi:hypothetical protein
VKRTASVVAGASALSIALSTFALPANADARATRPTVRIHVTSTKHVAAPDVLHPGLVHVRNTGTKPIYVIRRVKPSWGVSTLVTDYNADTSTGLTRHFRTIDNLMGHRDIYATLSRGTYYLVDGALEQIKSGSVHTLVIKGTTRNATKPASKAVPISGAGATLGAPSTLPTHRYLHFKNRTDYTLVVVLFRIGSGTSDAALARFVARPTPNKLGNLDIRGAEELWFTSPHKSLYYGYQARSGRYLMIDFAYTDTAMKPRFGKGQAVAIRVS